MPHVTRESRGIRPEYGVPRRQRVIVAEDEADIRKMLCVALRCLDYEVIEARSGGELLEELADGLLSGKRSKRPDLIITDLRMPGFTGLEILAGIRGADWSTSVVMMTAYADAETRREARELGVNAFFEKPFDIDDLLTAVINLPIARPRGGRLGE